MYYIRNYKENHFRENVGIFYLGYSMHANQKCLNPTSKNSVHRAEVVSPGKGESENIIGTVIMFICFFIKLW